METANHSSSIYSIVVYKLLISQSLIGWLLFIVVESGQCRVSREPSTVWTARRMEVIDNDKCLITKEGTTRGKIAKITSQDKESFIIWFHRRSVDSKGDVKRVMKMRKIQVIKQVAYLCENTHACCEKIFINMCIIE